MSPAPREIGDVAFHRDWIDLSDRSWRRERVACRDLLDLLGGFGRAFALLEGYDVADAYAPASPLVLNLGVLSGSSVMTGLRTYFHAYSPLKRSHDDAPVPMWSAGSGKLGTKLRFLGVDEIVFTGRCDRPSYLHLGVAEGTGVLEVRFRDADHLVGGTTHEKIMALHAAHPEAHMAVVGPAGEHYAAVRYGAIALSTENQLKSGDPKARYCGRGGMGSVMGSKNLLAIVADVRDGRLEPKAARLKPVNKRIGTGDGSRRFREPEAGGVGGTWANCEALAPLHAMPEYNFAPTPGDASLALCRPTVEASGRFEVKAEACFRCGIRCHKNVYEKPEGGGARVFRAKLDYEPLTLLSSNLGIFDVAQAAELIEATDLLGLDAISCGVTLSYVMEYNRAQAEPADRICGGLAWGDFEATRATISAIGRGELAELGQGVARLSEALGRTDFAMHCKGIEFPAYLPQTNPGYPWALAGGHMSMRTYLLLVNERETGVEYWVDAITSPARGLSILRDDLVGVCKFAGMSDDDVVFAIEELTGVRVAPAAIRQAVLQAFLRGIRLERRQGLDERDYVLPARVHEHHAAIDLPYFVTPEFFAELRRRVTEEIDRLLAEADPGS